MNNTLTYYQYSEVSIINLNKEEIKPLIADIIVPIDQIIKDIPPKNEEKEVKDIAISDINKDKNHSLIMVMIYTIISFI